MKTNITSWGHKTLKGIQKLFFAVYLLGMSGNCLAQSNETKIGFSLSRSTSGNGLGAFYNPGIIIGNERSQLILAAKIQQTKMHVAGGELGFEYAVMKGSNETGSRTELFVFANTKYTNNAFLTKRSAELERRVNKESTTNFNDLRFSTLEGYAGFGVKLWLSDKIKIGSCIGFGGYSTLNNVGKLHRENNSVSLLLNTGISFHIN